MEGLQQKEIDKNRHFKGAVKAAPNLLLLEGQAISTLLGTRVCFMGTNGDMIQGTIVLCFAMVSALLNSTSDAFIGIAIHV